MPLTWPGWVPTRPGKRKNTLRINHAFDVFCKCRILPRKCHNIVSRRFSKPSRLPKVTTTCPEMPRTLARIAHHGPNMAPKDTPDGPQRLRYSSVIGQDGLKVASGVPERLREAPILPEKAPNLSQCDHKAASR